MRPLYVCGLLAASLLFVAILLLPIASRADTPVPRPAQVAQADDVGLERQLAGRLDVYFEAKGAESPVAKDVGFAGTVQLSGKTFYRFLAAETAESWLIAPAQIIAIRARR